MSPFHSHARRLQREADVLAALVMIFAGSTLIVVALVAGGIQ
jgi:hypothetical protein